MQLAHRGHVSTLDARVRHVRPAIDRGRYLVGLEFLSPSAGVTRRWASVSIRTSLVRARSFPWTSPKDAVAGSHPRAPGFVERRRHPRQRPRTDLALTIPIVVNAEVLDISAGGALVSTPAARRPGPSVPTSDIAGPRAVFRVGGSAAGGAGHPVKRRSLAPTWACGLSGWTTTAGARCSDLSKTTAKPIEARAWRLALLLVDR